MCRDSKCVNNCIGKPINHEGHEGPRRNTRASPCWCSRPSAKFLLPGGGPMDLVRAILILTVLPVFAMSTENNVAKALHDLFDRDWEYQMEQNPIWASSLGDRRWNDKWSDESLSAIHARFEHSRQVLKELHGID